jgi:hypothetical protein
MSEENLKAIKIDPKEQTITEVEVDASNTLESIYQHIGVDCFDIVRIGERDWIYLDDMGHYRDEAYGFLIDSYPAPLLHVALIFGDQDPTTLSVEDAERRITFIGKMEKINGKR